MVYCRGVRADAVAGLVRYAEMYGAGQSITEGPAEAMGAEGSSLAGIGMCPEGIETNPVIYDLMSEWAFRCFPIPFVAVHVGGEGV
jgi:Alpha-N-acetylglucosaminidase (NAGLU) tim-barrel domain